MLSSLPVDRQKAILDRLTPEKRTALKKTWRFWARDEQLAPEGDWSCWLILTGRGWGKTRTASEWVHEVAAQGIGPISLIAPTAADARDVMIEGVSGVLRTQHATNPCNYEPSKRRITWANGVWATTFSAEDPESLRGPEFAAAWYDELCAWPRLEATYELAEFGLRLGHQPRKVVTTTPKPYRVLRELMADTGTVITRGRTFDNRANLSPKFVEAIQAKYAGTRLGRQELEGEILDDVPGALWTHAMLDAHRLKEPPADLQRAVIAIDPPVTTGEKADECGIIAAARGPGDRMHAHAYVLGDHSVQGLTPEGWARRAVEAYHLHRADRIVAEVNNGGDMIESMIKLADPNVRVVQVRASRGKAVRAEPVALVYEQGRVHHCGSFGILEDQMSAFTPDFDREAAGYSPDRVDALVWAMTDLLLGSEMPSPSLRGF